MKIGEEVNKEEKKNVDKENDLKGPSALGAAFMLLILCIHPYIQIVKYFDFCLHKEQILVTQTICEGFTWNDNNSYYNGMDYLNFSIEVSFKKKEVVSFNAHTLVYKENKYIGYIDSDFLGTSKCIEENSTRSYFEPQTTQKLYFHISHPTNTSWQNDELFKELYYGDLQDFVFITNVICVYFMDGTVVGHYLFSPSDFYYDGNGIIHYKDQDSNKNRYYYYDDKGHKHYSQK